MGGSGVQWSCLGHMGFFLVDRPIEQLAGYLDIEGSGWVEINAHVDDSTG